MDKTDEKAKQAEKEDEAAFVKRALAKLRSARRPSLKTLKATSKAIWRLAVFALVLGTTVVVWLGAILLARNAYAYLPMSSLKEAGALDLTTILFGASSIALFILSLFIAFVALIGWGTLKTIMQEAVEKVTSERLEKIENELRGRSLGVLGYVIGEMNVNEDFSAPSDEDKLREAFEYCQESYNRLKGTGLPAEFMTLNNLLGYACVLKETRRRGFLLTEAEKLKVAAQEHDAPNLLLTYAKTILTFSTDPTTISEACSIVDDIVSDPSSIRDKKQRTEAESLVKMCSPRKPSAP